MSIHCYNMITIISKNVDSLDTIFYNHLLEYFNIEISQKTNTKIIGTFVSHWNPPLNWLCNALNNYPHCWIKNEWHTDENIAGIWVGYIENDIPFINQISWKIPQE